MKNAHCKQIKANRFINFYLIVLIGLFLFSSCNKSTKERVTNDNEIFELTDSIKEKPLAVSIDSETSKEVQIDTCHSPSGLVILAWGPSDIDGQLYFFKNKKFVSRFYQEEALVGDWELNDSIVNISYHTRYYREGIGEPIPLESAVPGNYIEHYNDYDYLSEDITESDYYSWTEIKNYIVNNDGLYELVSYNLDDMLINEIIDLKIELE